MNEFNYFPIVLPTREKSEIPETGFLLAGTEDKGGNAELLL